jgi:hypothetical protein
MEKSYSEKRNSYLNLINQERELIDKNLDIIFDYDKKRAKYEAQSGAIMKFAIIGAYVDIHKKIIINSKKRINCLEKYIEDLDEAFFICEDEGDDY